MTRREAERHVGKTVFAWSGLRGCYPGELVEVLPTRPWRGRVKILAVVEYPVQGLSPVRRGFRERRPARFGEVWEFGNSSIYPHEGEVPDYRASLEAALRQAISELEEMARTALMDRWLQVLQRRLKELSTS